jgi:hypothetical protein
MEFLHSLQIIKSFDDEECCVFLRKRIGSINQIFRYDGPGVISLSPLGTKSKAAVETSMKRNGSALYERHFQTQRSWEHSQSDPYLYIIGICLLPENRSFHDLGRGDYQEDFPLKERRGSWGKSRILLQNWRLIAYDGF